MEEVDSDEFSSNNDLKAVQTLISAGVAGGLVFAGDAIIPGLGGAAAAVGAMELFKPAISGVFTRLRSDQEQRVATAAACAAGSQGLTPDKFLHKMTASPELTLFTAQVLSAVAATSDVNKVRMLARALANVASDVAELDGEAVFVDALRAIEPPHLRVLVVVSGVSPSKVAVPDGEDDRGSTWRVSDLADHLPTSYAAHLVPLCRRLDAVGAINFGDDGTWGKAPAVHIEDYGHLILRRLNEAAPEGG